MSFSSMSQLRNACLKLPAGNGEAAAEAAARQNVLTKPLGSLGRLEELAIWMARWQGRPVPGLDKAEVIVFAGSHGVTARGVSAFPAEVTAQMVANFAAGGAAINQLARAAGAELKVVSLEIERPTKDFTSGAAMSEAEFLAAVSAGYEAVSPDGDLLCLGEMGIGNTTAAAALAAALFGGGGDWVGRGTGVDDAGLRRKAEAVDAALALHAGSSSDPLSLSAAVGGRELAAILGAVLAARHHRIPVLLDGFVCTAAAAPLARLHPEGLAHAVSAHMSAEAGHRRLLDALRLNPLLDLGMRLGEGSGACLAVNVLRSALACHTGMASFAEAGVSTA
ncbi:nicotinate-nucleotide--dimethylbenzimidazole phosphoribosyltransferase [Aquamicrobium sp. LC103]|uniref:nicotinate-nucleotide--dimethylbenzimidazole phosphoribosyltransferase n=1 Tax=Aquamicrobium sp. LC103 TaxID=1120658 RepID=UPI00063EB21C|nr:nicotinate-nucleotide--dimethylbenzimidazole phosphoribosyltransferase [Aquamicrobium sp. LC103]TKT76688.1 nicotinate-nucleotide--dimethylbenzimidazole phosphoribosyltransferase [Aquamicrobium sp. LC103]